MLHPLWHGCLLKLILYQVSPGIMVLYYHVLPGMPQVLPHWYYITRYNLVLPGITRSHWYYGLCAGCVEALSRDRALLLAFWTVHRPPSSTALLLALRLLHALAPAPPAAWAAAAQGGALFLLPALLPVTPAPAHEAVSLLMPLHLCTR